MVITLASQAKDDGSIPFARSTSPPISGSRVDLQQHPVFLPFWPSDGSPVPGTQTLPYAVAIVIKRSFVWDGHRLSGTENDKQ